MSSHPDFEEGVKRLKVLADPDRLRIAACLLEESHTAAELAESIGKDLTVILEHLEMMTAAGFVECSGSTVFGLYSFRTDMSLSALGLTDKAVIDFGCCKLTLAQVDEMRRPDSK